MKTDFYKNLDSKDALNSRCMPCMKKYYLDNKDRLLNNQKVYKKKNRSKKMLMKDKREKQISISN